MDISIIGSGTMGVGIAHFTAQKNYKIILYDSSAKALKKGENNLLDLLTIQNLKITVILIRYSIFWYNSLP